MAAGRRRRIARAPLGFGIILLCAALPALAAGASIDRPAAAGEWFQIERALAGEPSEATLATLFVAAHVPDIGGALPDPEAASGRALLARARLSQVVGLFGLGLLAFLSLSLAGRRKLGLLAAALLAVPAPVSSEGFVLRPETTSALLGFFSLLFLQVMAQRLGRPVPCQTLLSMSLVVALGAAAALSGALAVQALPSDPVPLLLPGVAMFAIAVRGALALSRAARRSHWTKWPVRGLSRRLGPFVLAAVLALLFSAALVRGGTEPATSSMLGLLPEIGPWRWLFLPMAALGGAGFAVRLGLWFGGRGRVSAETLFLLHAIACMLRHMLVAEGTDALPAAASFAAMLANGFRTAVLLAAGRVQSRSDRN